MKLRQTLKNNFTKTEQNKYFVGIPIAVVILLMAILLFRSEKSKYDISKRDFKEIASSKIMRIATTTDPIGYYVSGDTIAGFNHDLLEALKQYTPIHFEIYLENSLDKSLEGLKEGKYDLVARNILINANLKSEFSFTQPLTYNKLILVQRKAEYNNGTEPIRNHLQLAGKTIYVPEDSPSIVRLDNLSHEIGDTIYIKQNSTYEAGQLAMMVTSGEIDYTVCDHKTAEKLSEKFPELDILTDIGFTHLEGWAVRANSPALLDSLNTWINHFKSTKQYRKLYKEYL